MRGHVPMRAPSGRNAGAVTAGPVDDQRQLQCACVEPIARLRAFLVGQKMWSKAEEERLAAECHERIEAAVERYLATAPRRPETMFDHLYGELPAAYVAQRREVAGEDDV